MKDNVADSRTESVLTEGDKVIVKGSWLIKAERDRVYSIVSNFERMPEHFPNIARSLKIINRNGDHLSIEAESASFGRIFPGARILIEADLLPGIGYRCSTRNITFKTSGEEELLLADDPEGTRIEYTYIVTVRNRLFRPIFSWLTRKLALPFWKRSFIDHLERLVVHGD